LNDHVLVAWSSIISNTEDLTTKDFQPHLFQVVPNTGIDREGWPSSSPLGITSGSFASDRIMNAF